MLNKKLFTMLSVLLGLTVCAFAQKQTVSGTVEDAYGPVVGAVIRAEGANAVTDLDGKFTITVNPSAILEVSCLGYKTASIPVNGLRFIAITLEDDSIMLEDAVAVGYGTTKKANLTGAVSVVKADALKDRTALDVGHMLQGSVPGLNVTSSSGRPGQAVTLNIRGWNSINDVYPLVLIDGAEGDLQFINPADVDNISVIKDAAAAAIYGAKGSAGVILVTTKSGSKEKEGKATVHYSGRFGLTAPTTRTDWESTGFWSVYTNNLFWDAWKPGDRYTKDYYTGMDIAMAVGPNNLDSLDPTTSQGAAWYASDMYQLWIRRNDVTENLDRPWTIIERVGGQYRYTYYANTDWWHELYNDLKPSTSHTITLSGANDHLTYLVSGGYTYEQGMFRQNPDKYNRYNLRVKLGFDVNEWLRFGNNFSYFNSSYSYPGRSGISNNFRLSTVHALASYPAYNPDGSNLYMTRYNDYTLMDGLMMLLNNNNVNKDTVDNISNTFDVTIKPFKGLTIKGDFTYTLFYKRYLNRSTNGTYSKKPGDIITMTTGVFEDKLTEQSNTHTYKAANAYATYQHSWNEAHNLKVMAGVNYESKHLKDITSVGYAMLSETLNDLDLIGIDAEGQKRTDVSGGQNEIKTAGYFARFNYDYKGRYLLELNGRYDGSSRFRRGHRWVFSPSVSMGWRISEEPFFQPLKGWWENAKIRASYGQLGNQQMGDYYPTIRTVDTSDKSSYLLGGDKPGVASLSQPVSENLTWERSVQTNIGLDLAFFQGRLNATAEAYIRDTKDMLTAGTVLPATYGYSSAPKENVADLRTKGYEITIGWKDSFRLGGKPFNWGASVLFSDYVSHITRFDNPEKLFAKTYWEGMKYGDIWGYRTDGFFKTDEEAAAYDVNWSVLKEEFLNGKLLAGDLKYVDSNGDGKISKGNEKVGDSGDWQVIGNKKPRYQYGINLDAAWNGFDLAVFFQGIGRCDWYPGADARAFWGPYARPYETFIPKNFLADCWSEDNPNAYYPRPRGYIAMSSSRYLGTPNDHYLQNIGYLRLKNLTFGYTLPEKVTKKVSIQKLRVFFSGENLFYIAPGLHSKYIDPEMAMTDGNLSVYPWQKTFMFGIDITL